MGCAASASVKIAGSPNPVVVTLIGLPGTGKTAILEYLAGEYDQDFFPISTIGVSIRGITIHDREYIFYDTNGLRIQNNDWEDCIKKSNAIILVFDAISVDYSLASTKQVFINVSKMVEGMSLPILGIFTKTDNPGNEQYKAIQSFFEEYFKDSLYSLRMLKKLDSYTYEVFKFIEDNTSYLQY